MDIRFKVTEYKLLLNRDQFFPTFFLYIKGQWLVSGLWFSLGTKVSSTNKTGGYDKIEILYKVPNHFNSSGHSINLNNNHSLTTKYLTISTVQVIVLKS
jgi:hypothetical protein